MKLLRVFSFLGAALVGLMGLAWAAEDGAHRLRVYALYDAAALADCGGVDGVEARAELYADVMTARLCSSGVHAGVAIAGVAKGGNYGVRTESMSPTR